MDSNCIYCARSGAITSTGLYVCDSLKCRKVYMVEPHNNKVVKTYGKNMHEFIFLVKISFATAKSQRRDMIFNPFPWMFKANNDEQFNDEQLGQVGANRNYELLLRTISMIHIDELFYLISESNSDSKLINKLQQINDGGLLLYQLIKFIIETKKIETDYSEINITDDKKVYKQFKIKHDPCVESKFMKSSNEFCYLFHGSSVENWHSIIRNGIYNTSGTNLQVNGAVHGNGVYLSDNLVINSAYSRGNLDNAMSRSCDIIVAVFQVIGDKAQYCKIPNVYVVSDSSKLLLRYLISIPVKSDLRAISLDLEKMYNRTHDCEAKMVVKVNSRSKARIDRDLKLMCKLRGFIEVVELDIEASYAVLLDIGFIIQIGIKFTSEYPFESLILWVISPIVDSKYVPSTGAIIMTELLRANWKPVTSLNTIIEKVTCDITYIKDGNYISSEAINNALIAYK